MQFKNQYCHADIQYKKAIKKMLHKITNTECVGKLNFHIFSLNEH